MGIFDKEKKEKNENDANRASNTQEVFHGWNAIKNTFDEIYPEQVDLKHYETMTH